MDTHTQSRSGTQTALQLHGRSSEYGTVQLPDKGMEREKDGGEQVVIERHQILCNTTSSIPLLSPLTMALKSS